MKVSNNSHVSKRKAILRSTKGFYGKRKNCYSIAIKAVIKQDVYRTIARKLLKRDMRRLWITRISNWARLNNTTYSLLVPRMHELGLNRKILSDMLANNIDLSSLLSGTNAQC
jgi:large subunit ribosomal protein L20